MGARLSVEKYRSVQTGLFAQVFEKVKTKAWVSFVLVLLLLGWDRVFPLSVLFQVPLSGVSAQKSSAAWCSPRHKVQHQNVLFQS